MEKTHWKKLENPDYLGAYALDPNKDLVVQIKSVGQEEVYNPTNNKKETCTVAHFTDRNIKPMILNVTNCKTIAKLYDTPYIEDWAGKYISIYIAKVKAFGDVVEALRIRNKVPTIEIIKCEDCGKVITDYSGKTARELADIAKRNLGKELCLECQRKYKKQMEEDAAKTEEGETKTDE